MKNTPAVIMSATVVMVVSLAMVLALVLVLLAELYCSLLLRRHHRRSQVHLPTTATTTTTTATNTSSATVDPSASQSHSQSTSPFTSFYSQGVLQAPRSFLFPSLQNPSKETNSEETKIDLSKVHQESNPSPRTRAVDSPDQICEIQIRPTITGTVNDTPTEDFVYISNPIYSNESRSKPDTPFETPDSSPSRLETGGSSSGEDDEEIGCGSGSGGGVSSVRTPPLTPMKKLPERACSVTLRSLDASGSDSNSNNGGSSSTSGSPCTSPSW